MKKHSYQNKGSILTITLICFSILLTHIISYASYLNNIYTLYQNELYVNEERLLTIYLKRYFKEEMDNGFLMTDTISVDEHSIHYTVDVMIDYYLINVTINNHTKTKIQYCINNEDLSIRSVKYLDS